MSHVLPEGFWDRPVITAVLSRGFGPLVEILCTETGMNQTQLGALLGASQPRVSRYANGQTDPTMETMIRLADELGMPPHARRLLGLAPDQEDAGCPLSPVKMHRLIMLAENIGRLGDDDDGLVDRWPELTRAGDSAEPWHQLARGIDRPAAEPELMVEKMTFRTRGFFTVAARLPVSLVYRAPTAHVRDVGNLLGAVTDEALRRELRITGGDAAYLRACCDVDLGELADLHTLLDIIGSAAERADDPVLAAMALDGQSHAHAFRGRHLRALEFVQDAVQRCEGLPWPGTLAYLWLRVAEEHAALHHTAKTKEAAAKHARQAGHAWQLAEAAYRDTDLDGDRNWVRLWLTRDCWDSVHAVICAARPAAHVQAAELAERVTDRLAGKDGKTDAVAPLNAALARARIGLCADAARSGSHAVSAIIAAGAGSCLPRAQEVATILEARAPEDKAVRKFRGDLDRAISQLGACGGNS